MTRLAFALFALAAILICADVLQDLRHSQYTIYPFLAPIILGLAGIYVTLARYAPRSARLQALLSIALGLLTAFFANMRSSHLPVYVLFFLVYAVILARRETARSRVRVSLIAIACFAAGYTAFGWLVIRPLIPTGPHCVADIPNPSHGFARPSSYVPPAASRA